MVGTACVGLAQLTFVIDSLPVNTSVDSTFYLAGNMNNWEPNAADYHFETSTGKPVLQLTAVATAKLPYPLEFKITRGTWDHCEGAQNGTSIPNRTMKWHDGDTLYLTIAGWEKTESKEGLHTANERVFILNDAFYLPHLKRYRRIWVYLPISYADTSKRFPVIYAQDGQNLFDAETSYSGEWKLDETLIELENKGFKGAIVVGIDNGMELRMAEYSPWKNEKYGGGEGVAFTEDLVHILKPYIDSLFRTKTDRNNTIIMGSSLGGLISHYAFMKYPEVFGKAAILSPAYWFNQEIYAFTTTQGKQNEGKIFILAGARESEGLVGEVNLMHDVLISSGYTESEIMVHVSPIGEHKEWFWQQEFEGVLTFLMAEDNQK